VHLRLPIAIGWTAFAAIGAPSAMAAPKVWTTPARPGNGQPFLLWLGGVEKDARVEGSFLEQTLRFSWDAKRSAFVALGAVPLHTKARPHRARLRVTRRGHSKTIRRLVRTSWVRYPRADVRIRERATERAPGEPPTKKERFGALPGERPVASRKRIRAAYERPSALRAWALPFHRPLATKVTERFGVRRRYFKFKGSRVVRRWRGRHMGLDLDGDGGEPIGAIAAGRVAVAGYFHGMGKAVLIDHGQDFFSAYFHMFRIDVREGDRVERAQTLGQVGATGLATGPHLHLVTRVNGVVVDPERLLALGKPAISAKPR
jgi:murein DD-endopeptidase MepM/ murein hydrolase activator NlpD